MKGAVLSLALAYTLATCSVAQMLGGMGNKGPEATAVKSDIVYIKCGVCELLAKQAYRQVKAAEKELKPGKKLKEIDLIERFEKITNPLKDEGEWLAHVDLVESGDKLLVKEMEEQGKCGTECKTVQRAAEDIMDSADTDMAEKLWQGKMTRSQFTKWLCREATSSCKRKTPKLPKDRAPGPAFEVVDPEEAKMAKMMATMKEMGMGGQVFDRDSAMKMASGGGNNENDDYDDVDYESSPLISGKQSSEAVQEPNLLASAQKAAQASLDTAKEAAKTTLDSAKKAASGLLTKAQSILGSNKASEL